MSRKRIGQVAAVVLGLLLLAMGALGVVLHSVAILFVGANPSGQYDVWAYRLHPGTVPFGRAAGGGARR